MAASSGPVSFQSAEVVLGEALLAHPNDGDKVFIQLELAAAQMAISLCPRIYGGEISVVDGIAGRIDDYRVNAIGGQRSEHDTFDVRQVLSDRENELYDAARTIVGLVYNAARENTQTVLPEEPVRAGRRSSVL